VSPDRHPADTTRSASYATVYRMLRCIVCYGVSYATAYRMLRCLVCNGVSYAGGRGSQASCLAGWRGIQASCLAAGLAGLVCRRIGIRLLQHDRHRMLGCIVCYGVSYATAHRMLHGIVCYCASHATQHCRLIVENNPHCPGQDNYIQNRHIMAYRSLAWPVSCPKPDRSARFYLTGLPDRD